MQTVIKDGLRFVNRDKDGLVFNDPLNPQCNYGFTDIVKKTGNLLFSSLLFFQSSMEMEKLCMKYSIDSGECYRIWRENIKKNISKLYDSESGMFLAATIDCRQIDIWGSAFAVAVGITTPEQTNRIIQYLIDNKEKLFFKGQLKHLSPRDKGWDKTFILTMTEGGLWTRYPMLDQYDFKIIEGAKNNLINERNVI